MKELIRRMILSVLVIILALAGGYLVWRQHIGFPRYMGAVSTENLPQALSAIESADDDSDPSILWSPVPFCLKLATRTGLTEAPECAAFYRDFPQHPTCALQNFGDEDWDPSVIQLDPVSIAAPLSVAMERRGCHSLILDIESLHAGDRDRFTLWALSLAQTLRRSIFTLHVSVAVYGKTEEKGQWDGPQAQDWAALCRNHDELLIMAYDYHYPGSTPPGEAAPLDWVEGVLRYGVSVCQRRQLRLGLAAYGYRWPSHDEVTEREWKKNPSAFPFVETAALRHQKIDLARRFGVSHFFLWALGME